MAKNYNKYQYETSPRKIEPEYAPKKNNYKGKKSTAKKPQTNAKKVNSKKQKEERKKQRKMIMYICMAQNVLKQMVME